MTPPFPLLPSRRAGAARTAGLAACFAFLLLVNFLLRLPTAQVADWSQFAFYDPGTVLKGDLLLAKGYIPTLDFGYTHGLLPLVYARIGFALLGRTPLAFFILTLLAEMLMAWALARIFRALALPAIALVIFLLALPMAIMPAYLTLTHPLEAMLILLALAAHAEGCRPRALALMTVCLFVKPSMAYVYGFLLVALILWHERSHIARMFRRFLPALCVLLLLFIGLTLWMGVRPVIATLLPATGAKTYAATGFGFFTTNGKQFWLPPHPLNDFITPAAMFLIASAAAAIGAAGTVALWCMARRLKSTPAGAAPMLQHRRYELLFTIGTLHTAFLLGFYGWTGSWTYYSYLPFLALAILITLLPLRPVARRVTATFLIALMLLSQVQLFGDIAGTWKFKTRSAATAGLWAYPDQLDQWREALQATAGQSTLLMTDGYLPNPPANVALPDAWFPEPGIPTPSEIARVKKQAANAACIIVWRAYDQFDLWNAPAFAQTRAHFQQIFENDSFIVLRRK